MTPTPKLASGAVKRAEAGDPAAPAADGGPFVLNLCSSSSPMALAQTDLPELKRFTFFVSRRFEEGRERFRLHMGYFASMAEAEEWLGVVRDIYPGAWAGEAPGKKLRERATAAAAAAARHAVGPQPRRSGEVAASTTRPSREPITRTAPAAASVRTHEHSHAAKAQTQAQGAAPALAPVAAATPIQTPAITVPTVHAATPAAAVQIPAPPVLAPPVARPAPVQIAARPSVAPPAALAAAAPVAPLAPVPPAAPLVSVARPVGAVQTRPTSVPSAAKPASVPAPAAKASAPTIPGAIPGRPRVVTAAEKPAAAASPGRPASAPAKSGPAAKAPVASPFGNSNVREVLAALDETAETGETRLMPAAAIPANAEPADDPSFTDTQVLRYLENRRSDNTRPANEESENSISLLKPDDTGTRRALKEAVIQNAPVSFAVQLQWSVQAIELDKVPPLAIFSAYTLYTVEGSRDGRKWYGLRLGFFSDAISAKQVAHYVRSEFASVAVVPVSPQEKTRATEQDNSGTALGPPKKARAQQVEEFKLIDHEDPKKGAELSARPQQRSKPVAANAAVAARGAPVAAARTAPQPPASAKRSGAKGATGGGKVGAREKRGPQTLEETLEILGASELEIDNGRGEVINEAGVRHLRVQVQKNTPFTRLLERLSERVKKP